MQRNGERQHNHPSVVAATNKRFTVGIKKKEGKSGKEGKEAETKFVIEKVYPASFTEQNVCFLRRLELYENYIMD